jgi:hypothetical protein
MLEALLPFTDRSVAGQLALATLVQGLFERDAGTARP